MSFKLSIKVKFSPDISDIGPERQKYMVKVLGKDISNEALDNACIIAEISGSKNKVEASDLKGLKIKTVNGEYNLNAARKKSMSDNEFAVKLQEIANRSGSPIVILLNTGQALIIKPLTAKSKYIGFEVFERNLLLHPAEKLPKSIGDWINANVTFEDNNNYFFPEVLYYTKSGDCNDCSVFAHSILSKAGYLPRFFLIYWPQNALPGKEETHDICVFQDKSSGLLNYIDNVGLHEIYVKDLQALFTYAITKWNKAREYPVIDGVVQTDEYKDIYRK